MHSKKKGVAGHASLPSSTGRLPVRARMEVQNQHTAPATQRAFVSSVSWGSPGAGQWSAVLRWDINRGRDCSEEHTAQGGGRAVFLIYRLSAVGRIPRCGPQIIRVDLSTQATGFCLSALLCLKSRASQILSFPNFEITPSFSND
jgi:hypothetical protein